MALFSRRSTTRNGRLDDGPIPPARLAELGMLPREQQNTTRSRPDPELDHIVAAAKAGDWRTGGHFLIATGAHWERRTAAIANLAFATREDDTWLTEWQSTHPDDPGAAAVRAQSTIDLAWQVRGGARASQTSSEQFQGFFRILEGGGEDVARAKALGGPDPSPYVADIWRGTGLNRPHAEMHEVWAQTVARDPYHFVAHRSALQYWCKKWRGSRELAFSFAERAAAAAPPGNLLASLWLTAWWEHRPTELTSKDYQAPDVMAAVDRTLADVAACRPNHPYLIDVRHMLAYFLIRQGRAAPALEQFRLVDGYVATFPWTNAKDPAELYCTFRDLAIRTAGGVRGMGARAPRVDNEASDPEEPRMFLSRRVPELPTAEQALKGRPDPTFSVPDRHTVLGNPLLGPYPEGLEVADFGMGCFWGAERTFWRIPGVWTTLVGYQGGHTPNPTYEEACSGLTGHTEAVRVVFDPSVVSYEQLLKVFWESHDPTQGFRQGNDRGTQYRSAIYTHSPSQSATAEASRQAYQKVLTGSGYGTITTELLPSEGRPFYPAEGYHQQYLDKNPAGYCGIGGTGVSCPVGVAQAEG